MADEQTFFQQISNRLRLLETVQKIEKGGKLDAGTDDELEQETWDPNMANIAVKKKEFEHKKQENDDTKKKIKRVYKENEEEYIKQQKIQEIENEFKQNEKQIADKKQYDADTQTIRKGGYFQIQVHIIEARDLVSTDSNRSGDPVCIVTIFNKTKSTKVFKNRLNPYWDQILYFNFNLDPNEVSRGHCLIKVYDHDSLSFDDLIGSFQFDLSWIYYKKHHEAYRQWVALTNTDDDDEEEEEKDKRLNAGIEGYLKCSITILGPNDSQYIHDEEADDWKNIEKEFESGMVLISPSITQTPYLLTIKIHKMRHLANTDKFSPLESVTHYFKKQKDLDPYIVIQYAGVTIRSNEIYDGFHPEVQTQYEIPVMEPVFTKDIEITVMDYDLLERNDRIGCIRIPYTNIKNDDLYGKQFEKNTNQCKKWNVPSKWHYIYGAPIGYTSGYARKMNKGLVEGSHFRGQVLLEVSLEKTETKCSKNIAPLDYVKEPEMIDYYLRADLYLGTEINDIKGITSGKVWVEVHVLDCIGKSSEGDIGNYIDWYQTLSSSSSSSSEQHKNKKHKENLIGPFSISKKWVDLINEKQQKPSQEEEEKKDAILKKKVDEDEKISLPDVFIYLCATEFGTGDPQPISYYRVPLREILGSGIEMWGRPPVWIDMKQNLALHKYEENVFPGSLLIGLNAGPDNENMNNQNITSPKKSVDTENKENMRTVYVQLYNATALPQLDWNGYSDPFVKLRIGKQMETSTVKSKKLDPNWNGEMLKFENVFVDEQNGDHLELEVWDHDIVGENEHSSSIEPIQLKNDKSFLEIKKLTITQHAKEKHHKNEEMSKESTIKFGVTFENENDDGDDKKKQEKGGATQSIFSLNLFSKMFDKTSDIAHLKENNKLKIPQTFPMQLRVHVFQAKNLLNRDISGLSDGYMVVRFCGEKAKTKIIYNHLDPQWFQTLYLNVKVPKPLHNAPRIYCEVFDYDYMGKNESLGHFVVSPDDISHPKYKPADYEKEKENLFRQNYKYKLKPNWYHLEYSNQRKVDGEVLVEFELIEKQFEIPKPLTIEPEKEIKWIHIITLGLRNIQSVINVHKCFIEFEINGTIYRTEASNVPSSRNPNYRQILDFSVKLPKDITFIPNLNITVKDSLCGGAIKRQIGYASVPLKQDAEYQNIIGMDEKEEEEEDKEEEKEEEEEEKSQLARSSFTDNKTPYNIKDSDGMKQDYGLKQPLIDQSNVKQKNVNINDDDDDDDDDKPVANEWGDCEREQKPLHEIQLDYEQGRTEKFGKEIKYKKPFNSIQVFNGRNKRTVGYFKGLISMTNTKKQKETLRNKILKNIKKPTNLYLRLYVLNAIRLIPKDSQTTAKIKGDGDGAKADPYLIIKYGDKKFSTRQRYIKNTLEPGFYEAFEIPVTIPGPSKLIIQVWDYDGIGDDLMGKTIIDIEDRWYSKQWRELNKNIKFMDKNGETIIKNDIPIEYRTLKLVDDESPFSSSPGQGVLKLWLELLTTGEKKKYPNMINIKPPPSTDYELRVIIWKCEDVGIFDEITSATDIFISGGLECSVNGDDEENLQETDTHFRSRNGLGSFNWRMKFPIKLPKPHISHYPRFKLQIWDKDMLDPNDCISEVIIDLAPFLRFCELYSPNKKCQWTKGSRDKSETKTRNKKNKIVKIKENKYRFWINMAIDEEIQKQQLRSKESLEKNLQHQWDDLIEAAKDAVIGDKGKGKVLISFELVPAKHIRLYPCGKGRDSPNKNPYLPNPEGRIKLSLFNPCDSLKILLGRKCCAKVTCIFCCILVVAFIVLIAPNLVSAIIADWLSP